MGSLFVMGMVALYLHAVLKILEADRKIEERKRAYLCFKYQIVLMKRYVQRMGTTNRALRASFLLRLNPKTAAVAEAAHRAALILQKGIHLKYSVSRMSNSYCGKRDGLPFVLSSPYREKEPSLVRNPDGTSQVRRSQWKIFYWYKSIVLSASLGPLSSWEKSLKIVTSEVL